MTKFWSRHPFITAGSLAVAVSLALALLSSETSALRSGDGASVYTVVVTAAAALAALGVVPISIVLGLSSPRVQMLTREKSALLRRTVALAVCWHLSTIVLSAGFLALDSDEDPRWVFRAAVVVLLALGVEATLRAVIEFLAMLKLEAQASSVVGPSAELSGDWSHRMTSPSAHRTGDIDERHDPTKGTGTDE